MKSLCLLASSALLLTTLHAQEPAPASTATPAPMPTGSLLQPRAPEFARWTVAYKSAASAPKPVANSNKPASTDRVDTVTKTKHIIHEETTGGGNREKWCVGTLEFTPTPDGAHFMMFDLGSFRRGGTLTGAYTDYTKTDFPGCEWIGPEFYKDVVKRGGRELILLKGTVRTLNEEEVRQMEHEAKKEGRKLSPEEQAGFPTPVTAYVDLETRLPIVLLHGDETRTYAYGDAPDTMLTPPLEVQTSMEARRKMRQQLAQMPARPF